MGISERRVVAKLVLALLLLLAMSAWRLVALGMPSQSPMVPYVAYATYVILVTSWLASIRGRMAQQGMRRFAIAEGILMFPGATLRFVQDTLLHADIPLMRASGYLFAIPLVLLPLFGWYGVLGLGREDDFRMGRRWWLLSVPGVALVALALTDEWHHLVFYLVDGEPQPNLLFHPNFGAFLMMAWYLSLTMARGALIVRRNRRLGGRRQMLLPALVACGMLVVVLPYFATSFSPAADFVEFHARVFFLEAMLWESCVLSGLVPVNTGFEDVLRSSTLAMQLLDDKGVRVTGSADAPEVSPHQLAVLQSGCPVDVGGGRELRARSDAERVRSRNLIYDIVETEVAGEVERLEGLLDEVERFADNGDADPHPAETASLLGQMLEVGGSIKRLCMSRLEELGGGETGDGLA